MNYNQYMGVFRAIGPCLAGWLIAKGYIPSTIATDVDVATIAVGAAIWSWHTNKEEHPKDHEEHK